MAARRQQTAGRSQTAVGSREQAHNRRQMICGGHASGGSRERTAGNIYGVDSSRDHEQLHLQAFAGVYFEKFSWRQTTAVRTVRTVSNNKKPAELAGNRKQQAAGIPKFATSE
jgi:hypothetical protein